MYTVYMLFVELLTININTLMHLLANWTLECALSTVSLVQYAHLPCPGGRVVGVVSDGRSTLESVSSVGRASRRERPDARPEGDL